MASRQLRDEPEQLNPAILKGLEFDEQSRAVWADVGLAQALMYADCDESTAQDAIKRLRPRRLAASPCRFRWMNSPLWLALTSSAAMIGSLAASGRSGLLATSSDPLWLGLF